MVAEGSKVDPSLGFTENRVDERKLDRVGLGLRNVRRVLIDVCGFGRMNYSDTDQRAIMDSLTSSDIQEMATWLTDALLNLTTLYFLMEPNEHTLPVVAGRVIIGAITGLRREAGYAGVREEILQKGVLGADKEFMEIFTQSQVKGGFSG